MFTIMTQQLVLLRHVEIDKKSTDKIIGHGGDGNGHQPLAQRDWPVSENGLLQVEAAKLTLAAERFNFDELLFGPSKRNRQTAARLIPEGEWQVGEFLDSRLRTVSERAPPNFYYGMGSSPYDQSFKDYLLLSVHFFFDRLSRRWDKTKNVLAVTCRELILAVQFRMEKGPISERVAALMENGDKDIPGILNCKDGEMIVFRSFESKSGRQHDWFRWKRRISPMCPERNTKWKRFSIKKYRGSQLLDDSLW